MSQNYRNNDPNTSKDAGESVTKSHKRLRYKQIVDAIKQLSRPMCTDELDAFYGVPNNTFSRRAKEAEELKFIFRTEIKATTRAKRSAFCWDLWENKHDTIVPKYDDVKSGMLPKQKTAQISSSFVQIDLFNIRETNTKERCVNCTNCYQHNYNTSLFYCKVQSGKRTAFGHKKIKKTDNICPLFDKIKLT